MTVRFVLAVILFLVAVPLLFVGTRELGYEKIAVPFRKIGAAVLMAALFLLFLSTIRVVAPGEVGIPITFGKTGTPFGAGVHFVNPLASVEKLSVRTENYTMSFITTEGQHKGDDSVSVLGADGAQAGVDTTTLFHLVEGDAGRVYKTLGTDYVEKIIRPTVRTCIRSEFARVPLVDAATTKRDEISASMTKCVEPTLTAAGIALEQLQLRDIHVSQTVQDSINAKVSAQQASEQQSFELSKTTQQAEIARVDAQGKADAQQIISCGGTAVPDDKGGTHVVPNVGAACQNNLTANYLQYLYIQTLQKVAEGPNHDTLVLPFDSNLTPLLNVGPK